MTPEPIVYLVDSDDIFRQKLAASLDSVGLESRCYREPDSLLADIDYARPCSVISDLRLPGMPGLELQSRLAQGERPVPIVFVASHGNVSAVVRAMNAGAVDFLPKPVDEDYLIEVVRRTLNEEADRLRQRAAVRSVEQRLEQLTPREREVLDGVVAGLTNKQIARELGISYKTVELHRSHMMEKMQARSIAEVTRLRLCVDGMPARAAPTLPRIAGRHRLSLASPLPAAS